MSGNKCISCGHSSVKNYCANCGEKRLTPELRSVKHIASDVIENLTSYDGKIWRTLLTLFCKPGALDYNYHIGKRVNYLKPVTLFLIINVLFVIFSPLTDFYVNFRDQTVLQPYSKLLTPYLLNYIEQNGMEVADFSEKYDQLVVVLARSLIILQVPFFALFSFAVLFSKKHYVSDYFIFSLNLHSWWMIWIVFLQLPAALFASLLSLFGNITPMDLYFPLLSIGKCIYLIVAIRVLFGFPWWRVLISIPIIMMFYIMSHYIFRFLQLVITLSLIE